jgi:hypothetical protein
MPGVVIGSATYQLTLEDQQFVQQLQRVEAIANARAQAIRAQIGNLPVGANIAPLQAQLNAAQQQAAQASAQIQARLGQIGPTATIQSRIMGSAFVTQFAAMAVASASLYSIINAIKGIGQAAQDAANAQRALNVQFGSGAAEIAAFTDQLSASQQRSRTQFKEAAALTSSLARNYGLTADEIKKVIAVSSDLAAVSGHDIVDATKRVEAGIRGEAESSEILGLSLQQNALKGSALLNASEKDRLVTMGNVEAAHLRLRVILQQAAFAEGAAAKQAREGSNQLDHLSAATANLNTTLGESTGINNLAGTLATAAESAENLVKIFDVLAARQQQYNELRARDAAQQAQQPIAAQAVGFLGDPLGIAGGVRKGLDFIGISNDAKRYTAELQNIKAATIDASHSQAAFASAIDRFKTDGAQTELRDLTAEMQAAAKAGQDLAASIQDDNAKLARRAAVADPNAGLSILGPTLDERAKAAQKTTDEIVAREQEGLRQRQAAADRAADQQIAAAERQRDGLIAASKAAHDAALAGLESEQKAADAAFAAQQRAYERDRDAAIKAADDVKRARLAAIQDAETAEAARLAVDQRNAERERDHELDLLKQTRDYQVEQDRLAARKLADARRDEDRDVRDARERSDQGRAAVFAHEQEADKARHEQRVANLKQEEERAKAAGQAALKALDDEAQALRVGADQALRGLDARREAEQRRHDAAIENIDQETARQTRGIQAQLDALDAAASAEQRQREDRSQQSDVTSARQGLRAAHESGDPQEIKRAQVELNQALEQISETHRERERDAERAALHDQLQQVQQRAVAEKAAQDEAFAEVQRRQDAEKQAVQDNLAAALTSLAQRADAEKASTDSTLANIQARTAKEQEAYDAHEAAAKAAYDADSARIAALRQQQDDARADSRVQEDRAIEDSQRQQQESYDATVERTRRLYDDPDTGILTKIHQEQEASRIKFDAQRADAQQTYDDEAARIHTLYDDPDNGLLAKLAQAKTDSDTSFDARRTKADETYQAEIDKINLVYNGPFGLIQRIKDAKQASDEYFDKAIADWTEWGKQATAALDAANPKLLEYIANLERIQALGGMLVGSGNDPGGFAPGTVIPNTSGGAPLTGDENAGGDAELRAAFKAAGLTPDLIAAACGPIAAAGLAEAFGEAGKNIDPAEVLKKSNPSFWNANQGVTNFVGVAANAGIKVHSAGEGEALAALKAGNPVVINQPRSGTFPGHYLLAQGIDAAGNIDLGNTGHVVGLGRTATLSQIKAKSGSALYYVADPTETQKASRASGGASASATDPGGAPPPGSGGSSPAEVGQYIKAKASALGYVNPSIPVAVWTAEGGVTDSGPGDYNTNGRPSSFGPFQLHYGGLGSPHSASGLGDTFTTNTGIRPGDPRFERASIDFALATAKAGGWGPWHAWKGDPWAGIKAMALGGVIDRPSLLLDMKTKRPWALAGERGHELVTPLSGSARGPLPPLPGAGAALDPLGGGEVYLQVNVGGRALEDFTISTMDRAQRDGRWRLVPR